MQCSPLESASEEDLSPLLDEEAIHWKKELGWDLGPTLRLLLDYIRARSLEGRVLRTLEGKICGYEYHVVEGATTFIGDLYVEDRHATPEAYHSLLDGAISGILGSGFTRRIECQLFSFNCEVRPTFESMGFQVRQRSFLRKALTAPPSPPALAEGIRIEGWDDSALGPASEVVFASYQDSLDLGLCRDYQSVSGCLRFLRNIIGSPGCGTFHPEASLLARSRNGQLQGVLIASQIGAGQGMIPQISVRPEAQGRGIGSSLLSRYFQIVSRVGFTSVSLSVSLANSPALRLYQRLQFSEVKNFNAYIWEFSP